MNLAKALDVVMISAGAFMMGSDQGQENEQPVHRVWLDDFGIGRYPVTNQDYCGFSRTDRERGAAILLRPDIFCSRAAGGRRDVGRGRGILRLVVRAKRKTVSFAHRGRVGTGRAGRTRGRALPVGRSAAVGATLRRLRLTSRWSGAGGHQCSPTILDSTI